MSGTTSPIFTDFLCILSVAMTRSFGGDVTRYAMYFRFMGVVMFAHNRDRKCAEIITNDTISLLFKSAISILVISNHNSFRVLFDKIASVYFISKIYLYFIIENGQPRKPALCQLYRHTFVPCGHEWAMPKKRILKVSQQSSAWICHHSVL